MKAMKAAASSGGMMRGPRGGMYRMVGGKKVYGGKVKKPESNGNVHQQEAAKGKHTVRTAGRVLEGVPSHETGAYHRATGTTNHPQFLAIAAHHTADGQIAKQVAHGVGSVLAGGSVSAHVGKMSNLGYDFNAHRKASFLHLDEAAKHPKGSEKHKVHRELAERHWAEGQKK